MEDTDESTSLIIYILYVAIFGGLLTVLRHYFKGAQFNEKVTAKDKVAVITGANTGIGLEIARELNLRKAKVYMLCRDEKRALDGKATLVRMGCDPTRLIIEQCDLANFESIRNAANAILKAEKSIDILVNNAGVMFYPKYEKTIDGHEMHWQSNHLGPFLLTELLLPALKASPSARIANLSSMLHLQSDRIDVSKIDEKKEFGLLKPYFRSKLANVMHARALTQRLRKEGTHNVIINSCHPGAVNTELNRHFFLANLFKTVGKPFMWFFTKTPRDGAQTPLYLSLSKKVDGISGKYFSDCAIKSENVLALDENACEDLYNYSLETCGLQK
ncbi:unnamed protein product, partial [Mesorhabditis belari]|uniref:Uncharacterized protein n=1 Tax=Mesorhabditis belari TaxID=2138241 RepID=A0AAF3F148_9BILA